MTEKPVSHGLGFGNGGLTEFPDGTVEYRKTMEFLPAFKVRVRDVVGFSVRKATRGDKKRHKGASMQEILTIQGSGTTLAEVAVNYGTAEKIQQWFHQHPDFGTATQISEPTSPTNGAMPPLIADELIKLSQLRDAGVLTPDEFATQKARLLGT